MITHAVTTNLDQNPWTDLGKKGFEELTIKAIGRLPGGMTSGKSTIAIHLENPAGKAYLAQTSASLFHSTSMILDTRDAIEEPREPRQGDTSFAHTVGQNPDLRFRLGDLGLNDEGRPCSKYVKVLKRNAQGHAEDVIFLDPAFTAADLRAIARDMEARQLP